jgi:signal transduction histidine kinase
MDTAYQEIEAFAEQLPVGIVILGPSLEFKSANSLALHILGLEVESLLFCPLFTDRLDNGALKQALDRAASGAAGRHTMITEIAGRSVKATISASTDLPGDEHRIILVLEDATELRRLEMVKRDFIGSILYRLRGPLTTMKTSLGMLSAMDSAQIALSGAEILGMGYAEVNRLHALLEDLRDLFYIETGLAEKEIELEIFPFSNALQRALADFRKMAPPFDTIERRLSLAGDLQAPVRADFARLKQVLVNLLKNACIFSGAATPVSIRVSHQGGVIVFQIEDHGIGIADDKKPLLFTKFFKEESVDARPANGNGLGLFVSKSYIELMGGTVSIESQQGVGTRVVVSIPAGEGVVHE